MSLCLNLLSKEELSSMNWYVYFIEDACLNIKIGVSSQIAKRMKALQSCNSMPLKLYFAMKVPSCRDAYALEDELHKKFKNAHVRGEWFKSEPIKKYLSQDEIITENFIFCGLGFED